MLRIRSVVNAELIAENKLGQEKIMQIGSGTNFEASKVEVYKDKDETLANIHLNDGYVLYGVVWNQNVFENQGVPEVKITINKKEESDEKAEESSKGKDTETNKVGANSKE